jgi:hypothetical protein
VRNLFVRLRGVAAIGGINLSLLIQGLYMEETHELTSTDMYSPRIAYDVYASSKRIRPCSVRIQLC